MKLLLLLPLLLLFTACGASAEIAPAPVLDRSHPIAVSSEFVNVAYSDGVTLQYRSDIAVVRVIDASGNLWESSPHDVDDDPLARGMIRMGLSSMLSVTFLSGAGNLSQETSMAASVRQNGLSAYLIPGGVRVEFYFPAQRTLIPVEITLENGTMLASVKPAHIERVRPTDDADEDEWTAYNRNHRLTEIGLLQHFMHAGVRHEGYILVPDGSGALIYLNNGRPRTNFNQPVYGRDLNNPPRLQSTSAQNILMPVFGMKRGDAAAFAVIESGASLANIIAGVSGGNSSFNSVGASFTVRPPASYTVVNNQGVATDILVTSDWMMDVEAISVRYHFMENGSGYSEMAQLYRNNLIKRGMTPSTRSGGLPLVLDIFGSVTRRMSVLGVPTNRNTPLTTFVQAGDMVDTLKSGGIENLTVRYNNWLPRGNYSTSPSRFSPSGSLGGRRGFRNFSNNMENLGVSLYMDVDFATAHRRPFLGFIGTPIIRDVANVPVRQTGFSLDTFGPADEPYPGWWMYSPRSFGNAVDTFVSNARNANISGLNFSILSNLPYSDIGRRHMDRGAAEVLLEGIARDTRAAFGALMGDAAGAFWLPHATFVVNTPLSCSGFAVTDVSVPFYQMVLHGYVDFSFTAYNLAADREGMVLRAAETGALLQLSVVAENPALLVETPLEWLMSPSFDYWHTHVLAAAHRLAPVYNAVAGATITSHGFPAGNVTRTVFSNGTVVIVNYNHEPHGDIPARDFIVIPGGA
jgi:hypothetical protein